MRIKSSGSSGTDALFKRNSMKMINVIKRLASASVCFVGALH